MHNPEVTVFLIGAYAKYNWPYVWVSGAMMRWAAVLLACQLPFSSVGMHAAQARECSTAHQH